MRKGFRRGGQVQRDGLKGRDQARMRHEQGLWRVTAGHGLLMTLPSFD